METEPTSLPPGPPLLNYVSHDFHPTPFAIKGARILRIWAAIALAVCAVPCVMLLWQIPQMEDGTIIIFILMSPVGILAFYFLSLGALLRIQSKLTFSFAVRDFKRLEMVCWLGWFAIVPMALAAALVDGSVLFLLSLVALTLFPIAITVTRSVLQDLAWRNVGALRAPPEIPL